MDNLDDLLTAAPPSLHRQHSIGEGTHQLPRRMGKASRFDAMSLVGGRVSGIDLR
jgi:hypothetical protein